MWSKPILILFTIPSYMYMLPLQSFVLDSVIHSYIVFCSHPRAVAYRCTNKMSGIALWQFAVRVSTDYFVRWNSLFVKYFSGTFRLTTVLRSMPSSCKWIHTLYFHFFLFRNWNFRESTRPRQSGNSNASGIFLESDSYVQQRRSHIRKVNASDHFVPHLIVNPDPFSRIMDNTYLWTWI